MNRPAPWRTIMGSVVDRQPFRVGGATVDPVSRDVHWPGGQERLQPQTLKVLVTLVSYRGDVVTRDELLQLCWDGRAVSDDVINRAIMLLRHLAERAGGFEIETVPRAGYRLVEIQAPPTTGWKSLRGAVAGAVALVICIAGLFAWIWLDRRPQTQGQPPTPSISVAAFSAEDNDPLSRQVAQDAPASLTHMLSQSGFAIVRDSSPNSDYLFSGRVRRTSTTIEATVQMVSRRDGAIAYSHDFSAPVSKAADLPDRIGATAAAELAWTGAEMVLDPREHLKPEIAAELLSAMSLTIEGHDSMRAYQLYRHAAAVAPDSAIAQLSLGIQTGFSISSIAPGERAEAVALGRQASDRARTLAPEFGDVYLTWCLLHSPVRMVECDAQVRQALSVDYSSSFVPGYLSSLYYDAGRIDEALQLARQSLANDPYKPAKLARMIRILEETGNSAEAERVFDEAVRLWPDGGRMRAARLIGRAERGDYDGLAEFAKAGMLDEGPFEALMEARRTHDLAGARRDCGADGVTPIIQDLCMTVLADLGDQDGSFAIAARLYPAWHAPPGENDDRAWLDNPDGFDVDLLTSPAARSMRADPRYLDLAGRLGLLAYWRARGLPDFCTRTHEPICARIGGKRT